ncbi:hypothetical protein BD779DRAFT_1465227 [Infundibulicybe gibba]|nr:hypothetical protein BD779DRAFT_1465227 [Infundibulicybe gibba]
MPALAAYLPNFLLSRFKRTSNCFILRLSLDVHVDHIFVHLCIEDIICLRRVNKAFFLLTHEPIIWKRFLERMNIPMPPIRPSFRYSLQATDFEVEQLVTRAISLDDNWRRTYPNIFSRQLVMAHYKILDMKLLPGGKYLVASVKDSSSYRFYLTVFALDHPKGHRALARFPTGAKVYNLQAKYMKFNDRQGIMVAYVRRTFKNDTPVDPSDYSYRTTIDPPAPFCYESMCLHISLDSLELLVDPQVVPGSAEFVKRAASQPPPFLEVAYLEADLHIESLSLFDFNGMPYLAVAQQPDEVVIIDLTSNVISTMICGQYHPHVGQPHRIEAIRILPGQKDILVVRTITTSPTSKLHLVEIFDAPEGGGMTLRHAKDIYTIQDKNAVSFHISDYGIPGTTGDQPKLRHMNGPPPPISIFFRTVDPIGVAHHVIWPAHFEIPATTTRAAETRYFYNLDHVTDQSFHVSTPHVTHVLPGAYRALMYTISSEDRKDAPSLVSLRRYINPEIQYTDYPVPKVDTAEPVTRRERHPMPWNVYSSLKMPQHVQQVYQQGGVAAITWDESIGRVCIAAEDEMKIRILDFAQMIQPDARFAQWKRSQAFLHSE